MLVGLRVHVKPAGETVEVRVTGPVKPFTGATVIVEMPLDPVLMETVVGLAATVKSCTVKVTVADAV